MKISLVFSTVLVLSIFGCTPQGGGLLGTSIPQSETVSQATKDAPFAYDITIDTISYNSCVSETVKSSEIHGIKMGANEGFVDNSSTGAVRGGIKLRSDFLQYVGSNFKPDYPETTIKPTQLQKILAQSNQNKDAFLNFGVRLASTLQVVPDLILPGSLNSSTIGKSGRDNFFFDRQLHAGYVGYNLTNQVSFNTSGTVLKEGTRFFNLSDTAEPAILESRFSYNNTEDLSFVKESNSNILENFGYREQYADFVRGKFTSNTYILAATFAGNVDVPEPDDGKTNHINKLKRPLKADGTNQSDSKAFGRGYQLKFETVPGGAAGWNKLINRLTQIREINLDTGVESGATSWSCENYLIVRPEQWNSNILSPASWAKKETHFEAGCMPLLADDLSTDRTQRIKRLRRHYPESQWNIGLFLPAAAKSASYTPPVRTGLQLCVSPRASDCYLPTIGILQDITQRFTVDVGIQYNSLQECYLTKENYGASAEEKKKAGRCAQFASICVRNSTNF